MNIRECYDAFGGSFNDVYERFGGSEDFVRMFILKFPKDESMNTLEKAIEEGNAEEAFRAAHTLKGLCANLAITRLRESVSELTEQLRGRTLDTYQDAYEKAKEDYKLTIDAIAQLD